MIISNKRRRFSLGSISCLISHYSPFYPMVKTHLKFVSSSVIASTVLKLWDSNLQQILMSTAELQMECTLKTSKKSTSARISWLKVKLNYGWELFNSKWDKLYMRFFVTLRVLLIFGMTKKKISLVKNGLKITALRLLCLLLRSFGQKTLTGPLRNFHQELNQLWKSAMNWSKLVLQNWLTKSLVLLKFSNVWKSSTSSQSTCILEMWSKTSSIWESARQNLSPGSHSLNLSGQLIKTTMCQPDNSAGSLGKLIIPNLSVSSKLLIGSDSTPMSM
jgi:hypothetical protein